MAALDPLMQCLLGGTYYAPATKHYNNPALMVVCDRCGKQNLKVCIGLGTSDLCMRCVTDLEATMKLTAHTYNAPDVVIETEPAITGAKLKERIAAAVRVPAESIFLFHAGTRIGDADTLEAIGVLPWNTTLHYVTSAAISAIVPTPAPRPLFGVCFPRLHRPVELTGVAVDCKVRRWSLICPVLNSCLGIRG